MRLQNKVALITGGANGIGLATVERFAKEGAKIILWDLTDKGNDIAEGLKKAGREVLFQKVSVTEKDKVQVSGAGGPRTFWPDRYSDQQCRHHKRQDAAENVGCRMG